MFLTFSAALKHCRNNRTPAATRRNIADQEPHVTGMNWRLPVCCVCCSISVYINQLEMRHLVARSKHGSLTLFHPAVFNLLWLLHWIPKTSTPENNHLQSSDETDWCKMRNFGEKDTNRSPPMTPGASIPCPTSSNNNPSQSKCSPNHTVALLQL